MILFDILNSENPEENLMFRAENENFIFLPRLNEIISKDLLLSELVKPVNISKDLFEDLFKETSKFLISEIEYDCTLYFKSKPEMIIMISLVPIFEDL